MECFRNRKADMSVTQNRVSFIRKSGDVGGGQKWESLLNHVKCLKCSWKPLEPRAAQAKKIIYVCVNMHIPT